MATSAPALASASALARPNRFAPPLMSAVLPSRGASTLFLMGELYRFQRISTGRRRAVCDGKGSVDRCPGPAGKHLLLCQKQNNAATRRPGRNLPAPSVSRTRENARPQAPWSVSSSWPSSAGDGTASAPGSNLQCNAREQVGILRQAKPMVACKYGLISLRYTKVSIHVGGIRTPWMASGLAKAGTD